MATVTINTNEMKPKAYQPNIFTLETVQAPKKVIFDTQELNLWYSDTHALCLLYTSDAADEG